MLSDFIEDLKQSKYYDNIVAKRDVVMLFVSGSRLIGVTDERSDYDLVAVLNESLPAPSNEFLTYDGVKVHWYNIPLTDFISGKGTKSLPGVGAVQFANIRDEFVIYVNPKYDAVYRFLVVNKNLIAGNGVNKLCARYGDLIRSVVETEEVLPRHHTKVLYHLCVASMAVAGERISDETRAFLQQIKRIRWKPVSDEAKKWCVQRLVYLKRMTEFSNVYSAHNIA